MSSLCLSIFLTHTHIFLKKKGNGGREAIVDYVKEDMAGALDKVMYLVDILKKSDPTILRSGHSLSDFLKVFSVVISKGLFRSDFL